MKADSSASRNAMTKTLLDYGFSKVKYNKLYSKDRIICTIKYKRINRQILKRDIILKDKKLFYCFLLYLIFTR